MQKKIIKIIILTTLLSAKSAVSGQYVCYQGQGCHYVATQVADYLWEDRYGSIAIDMEKGSRIYGHTDSRSSIERAEKIAMTNCQKKGGINCQIARTYWNQCIAVISNEKGLYYELDADTGRKAKKIGMESCETSKVKGCKVEYMACSKPYKALQGYHYE